MPRSWGLFSGAIMESGPIASWTAKNWTVASFEFDFMSKNIGCFNKDKKLELECLRSKPTNTYLTFNGDYTCTFTCCFQPIIDGSDIVYVETLTEEFLSHTISSQ